MIEIINGNLLESKEDLILHQVNCQGKMNSGVAKAIREKWGKVYDKYNELCSTSTPSYLLGSVQSVLVDDTKPQFVINMFSQENYGYDGQRYTSYDAMYTCLERIAKVARKNSYSVALPYKMGCDRGGANWNIVCKMIEELFAKVEVKIYKLSN